jgi:hypothetical protein
VTWRGVCHILMTSSLRRLSTRPTNLDSVDDPLGIIDWILRVGYLAHAAYEGQNQELIGTVRAVMNNDI